MPIAVFIQPWLSLASWQLSQLSPTLIISCESGRITDLRPVRFNRRFDGQYRTGRMPDNVLRYAPQGQMVPSRVTMCAKNKQIGIMPDGSQDDFLARISFDKNRF